MTTHPPPRNGIPEPPAGPPRRWFRIRTWTALAAVCLIGAATVLTLVIPGQAFAGIRSPLDDPTAYVVSISGDGQNAPARAPFERPLHVEVYDDTGQPLVGTTVTFRIVTGGSLSGTADFPGDAQTADVVTGPGGNAVSPALTAGTSVGRLEVTANVAIRESQGATFSLSVDYAQATRVDPVSGDGQSALAGTDFAHPLVVKVTDSHGEPVEGGSKVTFRVEPTGSHPGTAAFPGGQASATAGIVAGDGYATSPTLTAGSTAGTFKVTASVPDSATQPETVFTGTTLPQAATTIEARAGDYQFSSEDNAFPVELKARVLDQAGQPVPNPSATVTVTGPAEVDGRSSTTIQGGPDGVIPVPLTATSDSGPVRVTVTAGAGTVTFYEHVVPGRGAVTITTRNDGQQTDPGKAFPDRLGVMIQDGDSRFIPDFPVTFVVEGPATFVDGSQTATVAAVSSGVTYAPALRATSTQGPVLVRVSITGTDTTAAFHLEVGHANGLLIFSGDKQTGQQSNVTGPLTPFAEPLTVQAMQSNGKPANGVRVSYALDGAAFFKDQGVTTTVSGLTGSNGQFSAVLYARFDKTGVVTITATAPGYGSVTFTEAVVSP